jgi:hypothetical protein
MGRWKWRVTGYYNDSVKFPKRPGDLALQTVHADDHSKDVEVEIFENRYDIGEILVEQIGE